MFRVKNFLWCMSLETGGFVIGYLSYALFSIIGIYLTYVGINNIIDGCKIIHFKNCIDKYF